MSCKEVSPRFRKHLPDLLAGLAVFALLAGLTGWHIGIAVASDGSTVGAALELAALRGGIPIIALPGTLKLVLFPAVTALIGTARDIARELHDELGQELTALLVPLVDWVATHADGVSTGSALSRGSTGGD